MDKITVGVTGTGSLIGQAIIKSIKNSSLKEVISIIGFDYIEDTVGSYWVRKNFLLPDFLKKETKEEIWLENLIYIINLENIKALFIGIDFELKLFAKYKQTIESETKCNVIVSDLNVIEIADDKYLTYKFLKDNNLYYPETTLVEELKRKNINFPCILKPRTGARSKNIFIIKSQDELAQKLPLVNNPVIQELIGNPHCEYTCGVIYLDNVVKDRIVLKRYLKDGHTENAYLSKDTPKIIYDYVSQIAKQLKPFGPCNFQLRLDDNSIPKLFEINARYSGSTYMRVLFGFNEVEYILRYIFNLGVKNFNLRYGKVKRYYNEVFISDELDET